jgi:(p)ppGpp synthase/HD superfamily hydrolase
MTEKKMLSHRALEFATEAHRGQDRKYGAGPYITHPIEVAEIVGAVTDDEVTIAAAFLHDVVEDCGVSEAHIREAFGDEVAAVVRFVTGVATKADGKRHMRKAIDRDHYARGCARAQTVKVADIISNLRSVVARDPDFAQVYVAEKADLIPVLTKAHPALLEDARRIIERATAELAAQGRPLKRKHG